MVEDVVTDCIKSTNIYDALLYKYIIYKLYCNDVIIDKTRVNKYLCVMFETAACYTHVGPFVYSVLRVSALMKRRRQILCIIIEMPGDTSYCK